VLRCPASRVHSPTACCSLSASANAVPQAPAPITTIFMRSRSGADYRTWRSTAPYLIEAHISHATVSVAHMQPTRRFVVLQLEHNTLLRRKHHRRLRIRILAYVRHAVRHDNGALVGQRRALDPGKVALWIAHLDPCAVGGNDLDG